MYNELVKRLRDAAKMSEALAVLLPYSEGSATAELYKEAADTIEELQQIANNLLVKYQEEATCLIWEYNGYIDESLDHLQKEIRILQAKIDGKSEPLKEE